jgi:hypothetical protein
MHQISLLNYPAWHDAVQERAMALVSLPEAAQRLGVSVDTIKRRLRRGELKGQQVPRPQGYSWLIEINLPCSSDDCMADSSETNTTSHAGSTVEVLNLREMLAMAKAQIVAQQEQLTTKDKQIEQLHVLLQQAQEALPAPRGARPWWKRLFSRD